MGILELCGFANPEYCPPGLPRLSAKQTTNSKEDRLSVQTIPSGTLTRVTKAAPGRLNREPSFGSWDDAKIGAIRGATGQSPQHSAVLVVLATHDLHELHLQQVVKGKPSNSNIVCLLKQVIIKALSYCT